MTAKLQTNGFFSFLSIPAALSVPIDKGSGRGEEIIHLAAGYFWGVGKSFWSAPSVVTMVTGYMDGELEGPPYELVCTNATRHTETLQTVYSVETTCTAEIISRFFKIHDPTQVNRQGSDIGIQYRSVIWTTTPEQLDTALRVHGAYQEELASRGFCATVTEIALVQDAGPFWYAEGYHQGYLLKSPNGYKCHARIRVPCPVA